jgi:hypothetical protein
MGRSGQVPFCRRSRRVNKIGTGGTYAVLCSLKALHEEGPPSMRAVTAISCRRDKQKESSYLSFSSTGLKPITIAESLFKPDGWA